VRASSHCPVEGEGPVVPPPQKAGINYLMNQVNNYHISKYGKSNEQLTNKS
jgi:hypothetical protein